jgi:hypothetical protein
MFKSYKKGSHISRTKFRKLLKYFCLGINAVTTAKLSGINRSTINKIFLEIRKVISNYCEEISILRKRSGRIR